MNNIFNGQVASQIKRGCSEYPLKFPDYAKFKSDLSVEMDYPSNWKVVEKRFDKENLINPKENDLPSLSTFCLSDFHVMQKWIDYAKGLGDPTGKLFMNMPVMFQDVFDTAVDRRAKFGKNFHKN